MGNKIIEALIDSGSSVSLFREDVSKGIIELSRLSKDIAVLFGLGKYEVRTKESFQRKIELDGEEYSLTWHAVPTPSLEFQAVIGSDILEQASVYLYKKSVQFRKHEDKNCFLQMQVYEAEVEDEIVVQHVTNPQIRRELFELISNYEPKKTNYDKMRKEIFRRPKQKENKRTYDRKRKEAPRYEKGDLVAIQRTQFGSGLKLRPKFLGPYKVIEVKPRDRYNLERVGNH
ncbi:transposon Tf2-9 polyprotein [Trichonephila clavipes]|nr:transposon Tf2-9 polyprotein [Trichonephila clavipes]